MYQCLQLCWQVLLEKPSAHGHGDVAREGRQHFAQRPGHFHAPFLILPISAPVQPQAGWEHSETGQWLIKSNGLIGVVSWM